MQEGSSEKDATPESTKGVDDTAGTAAAAAAVDTLPDRDRDGLLLAARAVAAAGGGAAAAAGTSPPASRCEREQLGAALYHAPAVGGNCSTDRRPSDHVTDSAFVFLCRQMEATGHTNAGAPAAAAAEEEEEEDGCTRK